MAPHPIEVLAKRFPAETVATQFILNKDDLDLAGQDFLCQNVEKLKASTLLGWLSHPGAVEAKVPIQRVVAALVAKLDFSSVLMPLQVLPGVERIPENLRRLVVEAFVPLVDPELQPRVLKVAPGSAAFRRIRDTEQRVATALAHELGLAGDRPDAYLTRRLLEVAHHDGELLLGRVRSLLAELDVGERLYCLGLLSEAGLLAQIGDVMGLFSSPLPMRCEAEGEPNDPGLRRVLFEHRLVLAQLGQPGNRPWYVEQVLGAAARGIPWEHLVWELPDGLLQEIALASMTTASPAPWVGWVLIAGAKSFDLSTWDRLLDWMEQHTATIPFSGSREPRFGLHERLQAGEQRPWHLALSLFGPGSAKACRARLLCDVAGQQWCVMTTTPLPPDGDEKLERRFIALKQRMVPEELLRHSGPVEPRFTELPLTRERATRYLRATLARGLTGFETSRLDDLIDAAEPVPPDVLPEPAHVNLSGRNVIRRYRRLGGAVADEVVRAAMRATATEPRSALYIAGQAPDLVDDKVRDHVRARLDGANLDEILHWHEDHPTIVTQDHVDRAAQIGEVRWDSKRIAMLLPRNVLRVMEWWYRADQPYRMKELRAVLEASPDLTPAWFVELILLRVRERGADQPTSEWLAALLKSRSAWKQHGHRVLRDYLKAGDAAVHMLLVAFYRKEYDRLRAEKTPSAEARGTYQKAVQEIHQVFAEILVEHAKDALRSKDVAGADAALRGVVCLKASRIAPALHKLRRAHPDLPEGIAEMLDVAYEMARYEKGREADVDDVVEALKQFRGAK